jgi:hypothetical protein
MPTLQSKAAQLKEPRKNLNFTKDLLFCSSRSLVPKHIDLFSTTHAAHRDCLNGVLSRDMAERSISQWGKMRGERGVIGALEVGKP